MQIRNRKPGALTDRFDEALADSNPAARLRATADLLLDAALEQPELLVAMLACIGKRGRAGAEGGVAGVASRFLVARVSEYMELNHVSTTTPEQLAIRICAHAHGMVSLHLGGHLPHDEEALRRAYSSSVRHLL